jgi:O-antigen ligase
MLIFFLVFVFLLSSKTILLVLCIAAVLYLLRQKAALINKKKIAILTILALIIVGISSITLYERFLFEKHSKFSEVLEKETFGKVYYWTGSSIRLMQLRILKEQLEEESITFNGFGLFASRKNLDERHEKFDTYFKFHHYNYHNQYAQMLSELGIFGLLLLLMMLISIWLRALKTKNFFFLMFGIMMTFIFFTESVLWRQRGLFLFIIIYALMMSVSSKEKQLAS